MKFKLINENTRGLNARPSQDLVNEELLTEDQWYEVAINPNITINGTNYNNVYIWAKNDKGAVGKAQVQDIFNSAYNGYYRGRGKEQSFNRDVADAISSVKPTITNIVSMTGSPTATADNILSKNDRSLRQATHGAQESNIRTLTGHKTENILIHHLNKRENDFTPTNLVAAVDTASLSTADSKLLLDIAHGVCHLTQQINGGISPLRYVIPVYDFSSGTPIRHNLTINLT